MSLDTSKILSNLGCLVVVGGSIACVVLAILIHPWFFVGVFLLLGVWIAYVNIREKQHRRACLSAFEDAFERFGGRAPALEIKSAYGFPAFTITFESEEDLERAESEGYIRAFKDSIQELCGSFGRSGQPFDADAAVYATFEGKGYN